MSQVTAYIGIGANLAEPRLAVEHAINALAQLPQTTLAARSSLFMTAPIEADGDDYINAVVQLHTSLDAHALLAHLQDIEAACGRERPYRHAPRTLDLDLLLYGQQRIDTATLTVPHPRMTARAFALIPLLQIDPLIGIPGFGPAHQFVPAVAGQRIARLA
ncbi:MAG: 2-amino-4-hydroxy-6-hydroxymethyldihydropteridine diphosphokinase [Pseudomonadota bacterium]|nr:2-amino-4-hydroxy-6-hydroxymethyldihydropteridine diphosphokinase [Pseudomonadota bacterium]